MAPKVSCYHLWRGGYQGYWKECQGRNCIGPQAVKLYLICRSLFCMVQSNKLGWVRFPGTTNFVLRKENSCYVNVVVLVPCILVIVSSILWWVLIMEVENNFKLVEQSSNFILNVISILPTIWVFNSVFILPFWSVWIICYISKERWTKITEVLSSNRTFIRISLLPGTYCCQAFITC